MVQHRRGPEGMLLLNMHRELILDRYIVRSWDQWWALPPLWLPLVQQKGQCTPKKRMPLPPQKR